MKLIYCLFIIFLLIGCRNKISDPIIIIKIKESKKINSNLCRYYSDYKNFIIFIDSCGKYTVGDTIKIVKK